jgi:hypothetical protein
MPPLLFDTNILNLDKCHYPDFSGLYSAIFPEFRSLQYK